MRSSSSKFMSSIPPTKEIPKIYHNMYKSFGQVGISTKREETVREKNESHNYTEQFSVISIFTCKIVLYNYVIHFSL